MTRKFSSTSVATTLLTGTSSTATTIILAADTGAALMGGVTLAAGNVDQFTVALDVDTQNEEIVFVTAISGDTLTVVRGRAGTSNITHNGGASVKHVLTSDDLTYFTTESGIAATAIQETIVAAKGDLIAATANDTVTRLSVGTNNQVLTADSAETAGIKWAAIPAQIASQTGNSGKYLSTNGTTTAWTAPLDLTLNAQTGTTYTAVIGDKDKLITLTNASGITLTIPSGVFAVGDSFNIAQLGAGQVTIVGSGTSVNSASGLKLRVQYSVATVVCTATNTFLLTGDLTA